MIIQANQIDYNKPQGVLEAKFRHIGQSLKQQLKSKGPVDSGAYATPHSKSMLLRIFPPMRRSPVHIGKSIQVR